MIIIDRYEPEAARLSFLVERDGVAATVEWAKRTRDIYRAAIAATGPMKGAPDRPFHFASTPHWRERFKSSIYAFQRFINDNMTTWT